MKKEKLNTTTNALIIGSGLSRGAFFAVFPFLAIYLSDNRGFGLGTIGLILGFGPLLGSLVGFYGGYLADFFGRKKILVISLALWGGVQILYGHASSIAAFFILSGLNGVFRAVAEPVIQAVIADNTTKAQRPKAFHLRYYAINVGAAVGPLVGSSLLLTYPKLGFLLAGLPLILFACSLQLLPDTGSQKQSSGPRPGFFDVLATLKKDTKLLYYVSASIFCALAYSQVDSILPLIMKDQFGQKGIKYFSYVISANAITIVTLQIFINRATQRFNVEKNVIINSLIFAVGFLGFAFSHASLAGFLVSMIVLSIGEITVFSNGFLLIDKLAPPQLRATYHSSANLYSIGICAGPPLGAVLLKSTSAETLFVLGTLSLLMTSYCYFKGSRTHVTLAPQKTVAL